MSCAICRTRRPRRACPGIHADICAICCGEAREVTVNCPPGCEYLQEARKHEPRAEFDTTTLGNPDIRVTEEFLQSSTMLLLAAGGAITVAAANGAVDSDVREALASLVQTYRTLQSGLIYEGLPGNPLAAHLHRAIQEALGEFRRRETQQPGISQPVISQPVISQPVISQPVISKTRDSDVLRVLVFLERMALTHNNGRPRGRNFLDKLRGLQEEPAPAPAPAAALDRPPSTLILPG